MVEQDAIFHTEMGVWHNNLPDTQQDIKPQFIVYVTVGQNVPRSLAGLSGKLFPVIFQSIYFNFKFSDSIGKFLYAIIFQYSLPELSCNIKRFFPRKVACKFIFQQVLVCLQIHGVSCIHHGHLPAYLIPTPLQ